MKKYLNIILSSLSLLAAAILASLHFEYGGLVTILYALIAIFVGYQFGTWTCHLHTKKSGFWITIAVFILLNFLHSLIDGASVGDILSFSQAVAVLAHEFARQPALYIVLWGMLTPFMIARSSRLVLVPLIVTGTWFAGVYIGREIFTNINAVSWLEPVADQAIFLFIGDIVHHVVEEYRKLRNRTVCCHH